MEKLISCIVPVHQSKETLQKCVNSLLASKYPNYEILLIHYGEDDGSQRLAADLAEKDARIKNIHSEKKNASAARNFAISQASGEYICFCEAADSVIYNWLERLSGSIQLFRTDMVCCSHSNIVVDEEARRTDILNYYYFAKGLVLHRDFLLELSAPQVDGWKSFAHIGTKIFRKSFLLDNQIDFNEDFTYNEDFDFVLNCMLCQPSIFVLNECLYQHWYTQHPQVDQVSYQESILEVTASNIAKCLMIIQEEHYDANEKKSIYSKLLFISLDAMAHQCRSDATISDNEIKEKLSKFVSNSHLSELYACYVANEGQRLTVLEKALDGNVTLLLETFRNGRKEVDAD